MITVSGFYCQTCEQEVDNLINHGKGKCDSPIDTIRNAFGGVRASVRTDLGENIPEYTRDKWLAEIAVNALFASGWRIIRDNVEFEKETKEKPH